MIEDIFYNVVLLNTVKMIKLFTTGYVVAKEEHLFANFNSLCVQAVNVYGLNFK